MSKLSYLKIDGSYEETSNVYVKTNNTWIETDIVNVYWKHNTWSEATNAPQSGTTSSPVMIHNYSQDYLTFDILSDGYINWTLTGSTAYRRTISYSKDNGNTWTNISATTAGAQIAVNNGDKLLFKGTNSTYGNSLTRYNTFSGSTAQFNVEGNIMSLFYGDDFAGKTTLPSGTFSCVYLFQNTNVRNAKQLKLPATTLADRCYQYMFQGCTSLTTAPSLPATTLTDFCYASMFYGCTNLTTAPSLPATTLANYCYYQMFYNCTSLTTAPELPATTLAGYCYQYMFQSCTNLTTAPSLPATTLANRCYASMFYGCTNLTTAPSLPATMLANYCYYQMFYNCGNVNHITCLATNISASNCLNMWVYGVASTGTFVKAASMTSWPSGTSGIPSGWTVQDAT